MAGAATRLAGQVPPWDEMLDFCEWLSRRSGVTIRYPSGSEWEYACRAGSPHDYMWGDDPGPLADYAWYGEDVGSPPHPVATLRPNRWGFFYLVGKVDARLGVDIVTGIYDGESERLGLPVYASSRVEGESARGGYGWQPAEVCRCGFTVWRSRAGGGGGFRPAATFPE
jgi:formylglycine-generating enzyme required for sulfatase activity